MYFFNNLFRLFVFVVKSFQVVWNGVICEQFGSVFAMNLF